MGNQRPTLFLVFAHPDDESFLAGGTIALAAEKGVKIFLLVATRGEKGQIHESVKVRREELSEFRAREVARAAKTLGVYELQFLGFHDGTLLNQNENLAIGRLVKYFESIHPDTVITFGPDGITGHRDHQTVGSWTTEAFKKASALRYITPTSRLYWCAVPKEHLPDSMPMMDSATPRGVPGKDISTIVDIREAAEKKRQALLCHQSQQEDVDAFLRGNPHGLHEERFRRIVPAWEKGEKVEKWIMPVT